MDRSLSKIVYTIAACRENGGSTAAILQTARLKTLFSY